MWVPWVAGAGLAAIAFGFLFLDSRPRRWFYSRRAFEGRLVLPSDRPGWAPEEHWVPPSVVVLSAEQAREVEARLLGRQMLRELPDGDGGWLEPEP